MKNLKEYIKEGLFYGIDNIEEAGGMNHNVKQLKKEIIEWIIKNNKDRIYKNKIEINTNTTPWTVNYDGDIHMQQSITSLNNDDLFQWGEVKGSFDCSYCKSLKNLEGAPEKVERNFDCSWCTSLKSLEGSPKEVGGLFDCSWCTSLTSLVGAPEKADMFVCSGCTSLTSLQYIPKTQYISCSNCENLKSLKGAPKELAYFYCVRCKSLTSLKGSPEVVERIFDCRLTSITSLEGCPKEVGGNFVCNDCKTQFTEEDVRKVSKVKGDIIV